MTRERAIEVLDRWCGYGHPDEGYAKVGFEANINDVEEAHDMAIAALREQEEYEGLKNSYDQLQAINDQLYLSNQKMGADLQKLLSEQVATDKNVGRKMTNADRIRAMSDEELAEWLEQIDSYNCDCCIYQHDCRDEYGYWEREHYDCKKGRTEWIKQPVKEDA